MLFFRHSILRNTPLGPPPITLCNGRSPCLRLRPGTLPPVEPTVLLPLLGQTLTRRPCARLCPAQHGVRLPTPGSLLRVEQPRLPRAGVRVVERLPGIRTEGDDPPLPPLPSSTVTLLLSRSTFLTNSCVNSLARRPVSRSSVRMARSRRG